MSFNKQSYISSVNKSPTERLVDESTFATIQGQSINVVDSVVNTAKQLLLNGTSIESIRMGASAQSSALTSNAEELYFALAGLQISRTGGKNLSDIRRNNNQSTSEYFRQTNPSTRIEQKRKSRNIEILSAI